LQSLSSNARLRTAWPAASVGGRQFSSAFTAHLLRYRRSEEQRFHTRTSLLPLTGRTLEILDGSIISLPFAAEAFCILQEHQFAVFGMRLTSDQKSLVTISNQFIIWDVATGDLARVINPNIDGVFFGLSVSSDDKYAAAFTNNNLVCDVFDTVP
jgi:hypothetical protein